jgi:hypothetical protein
MTSYNERNTNADQTVSAYDAVSLSESDTATFKTTRAVYVGGTGDLVVTMNSGNSVTFSAVPAGALLPIQITQFKTASTATLVLGLY